MGLQSIEARNFLCSRSSPEQRDRKSSIWASSFEGGPPFSPVVTEPYYFVLRCCLKILIADLGFLRFCGQAPPRSWSERTFSLSLLWATSRTKEIPGFYCLKPQISGSYCFEIIRQRPCDALTRSPNPVKPALSRDNGVLCSHWLTGTCCPLIGSPGPGTAESADLAKGWRHPAMASDRAR